MKANKGTFLCLPYDIDNIYAFWCARYTDISYEDFMKIKKSEFNRKIGSIPKNEPLYEIIQSRVINLGKIKNKEEKKYWEELKRIHRIPDIYLSSQELESNLKKIVKGENKNGNGIK